MAEQLREVQPGEPVTAHWANGLLQWIQRALKISVAFPLEMQQGEHGTHIRLAYVQEDKLIELTEDLSAGGSAMAKRLIFDEGDWVDMSTAEIEVFDSVGGSRDGASGDRGWAFYSRDSGRWELKVLGC